MELKKNLSFAQRLHSTGSCSTRFWRKLYTSYESCELINHTVSETNIYAAQKWRNFLDKP